MAVACFNPSGTTMFHCGSSTQRLPVAPCILITLSCYKPILPRSRDKLTTESMCDQTLDGCMSSASKPKLPITTRIQRQDGQV